MAKRLKSIVRGAIEILDGVTRGIQKKAGVKKIRRPVDATVLKKKKKR